MINPNDPIAPVTAGNQVYGTGIPIKLELASRFMAAMIAHPDPAWASVTYPEMAHQALKASDALITEFNNQQKEGK